MTDEGIEESHKRIARIQVWSGTSTTVGGVVLGGGVSMWITAVSVLGTASTMEKDTEFLLQIVNMFLSMGQLFTFAGAVFTLLGFLYPIYLLRRKSQKNDIGFNFCKCGNKRPCSIHMG
jgi:hypothetical protein